MPLTNRIKIQKFYIYQLIRILNFNLFNALSIILYTRKIKLGVNKSLTWQSQGSIVIDNISLISQ